jgi:hypothetical protein
MAVSDHISRVNKLRGIVTTVDPGNMVLEITCQDRQPRRIFLADIPSGFVWPAEGEQWSIYEENGYWRLGNRFPQPNDAMRIENMGVGEGLTPAALWTPAGTKVMLDRLPVYTTTLPSNPFEGQEIYLRATGSVTSKAIWHMRWTASYDDAYKWEFLGGAPLYAIFNPSYTTTAGTWVIDPEPSLRLTLTFAGEYDFEAMANVFAPDSLARSHYIGLFADGAIQEGSFENVSQPGYGGDVRIVSRRISSASSIWTPGFLSSNGTYRRRQIRILPVRLG